MSRVREIRLKYDSNDIIPIRIRNEVTRTGKLQNDIAKDLGISPASLSRYMVGDHLPGIKLLVKIAQYFDVTTDYMLGQSSYRTSSWQANRALDYAYENGYRDGLNEAAERIRDVIEELKEEEHEPST